MGSTTEPLGLFSLADVKIANIVETLPPQVKPSNKFSTPYGCAFVFHPVREEVELESAGTPPLYKKGPFLAPLYGGPPMEEPESAASLARYAGFTEKTEFLSDRKTAEKTLLGKTAVCMAPYGPGRIVLSGPHLEHPGFAEANTMVADCLFFCLPDAPGAGKSLRYERDIPKAALEDLRREVSNMRIAAFALEREAVSWKIGRKYYEPEKIRTYVEALWKRLEALRRKRVQGAAHAGDPDLLEKAAGAAGRATPVLRELKRMVDAGEAADHVAADLFSCLRPLSKDFFSYYFSA